MKPDNGRRGQAARIYESQNKLAEQHFQVFEAVRGLADETEVLTGVPLTRSTPLTVMLLVLRFTPSS